LRDARRAVDEFGQGTRTLKIDDTFELVYFLRKIVVSENILPMAAAGKGLRGRVITRSMWMLYWSYRDSKTELARRIWTGG
jgi:hypothetical protein